ncbi:cAMP-responsive element-binding protein 2 [Paragonimus skrjabini miyazakii]|uniref:cAMP-responsive element-binding protein 2 n=1 Tax=Paragonimus skrjabini miyazakii TaxID=59628 RepID=A0A8S9YMQ7_9TREM|nr:cAMP-responsive element-binding protein 2 [Paragonimus skrjabini miyazakii]
MKRANDNSVTSMTPTNSRGSESAKDCRKRKTLRIQYLAEIVRLRELTVLKMREDVDKLLEVCRCLDRGELPEALLRQLHIPYEYDWIDNRITPYS